MDQEINNPLSTFVKARQLLGISQHDEAWCASGEALITEIGTHIATAEVELDHTTDPDVRQQITTRIGQLIATRQKLERAIEAARGKSSSLVATLKHALGLEDQAKNEVTPPDPEKGETGKTANADVV